MNSLPNDLKHLLFDYLLLTTIRIFGRTCIELNGIAKEIIPKMEIKYFGKYFEKHNIYKAEKFTFELCHDKFYNMIPDDYKFVDNSLVKGPVFFNNISFLEKLKETNNLNDLLKEFVIGSAIKNDQIDVLVLVFDNHDVPRYDFVDENNDDIYTLCAKFNSIKSFKWVNDVEICFKSNGVGNMCTTAAKYGNIEILRCANDYGFVGNLETCLKAAKYGNFDCLKYAYESGWHLKCLTDVFGDSYLNESEFYPTLNVTHDSINNASDIITIISFCNEKCRSLIKQDETLLDTQENNLTREEVTLIHNKILCYNYICEKNEYISNRLSPALREAEWEMEKKEEDEEW